MPIKQVVCSVCKQTVNKAVTYHVGGTDRACKSHEGVIQKKESIQAEKAKKVLEDLQKHEHRLHSMRGESWSQDPLMPKCWVCMNTGLRSQEFFMRYLVEVEKQSKITGQTLIPLPGWDNGVRLKERCIFTLTKEAGAAAMKYVRDDFRVLVDMSGLIAICGDCCRLNKIDPMPKIDWKQLMDFMPISELVIRPAIEAQAVRELGRDN